MIHKYLLYFFLLVMTSGVFAQSPIEVQVNVDSIQIGDRAQMTVIARADNNIVIEKIHLQNYDSIESAVRYRTPTGDMEISYADFEILDYGDWKKPANNSFIFEKTDLTWSELTQTDLLKNILQFTIWNEGVYLLPSPKVTFSQNGRTFTRQTKPIPLFVSSPLVNEQVPQDSVQLADIKPIIEEPITLWDYLPYLYLFLVVIHLVSFIYFLTKNTLKEETLPLPVVQIMEEKLSLLKLKRLYQTDLLTTGVFKEYLSIVVFILREYLENRFSIRALDRTSNEIWRQLQSQNIASTLKEDLQKILDKADLIKFAKAATSTQELENATGFVQQFINQTKSDERLVWVNLSKWQQLKDDKQNHLPLLDHKMSITDNLSALTKPKKLTYAGFWQRLGARLIDFLFFLMLVAVWTFLWSSISGGINYGLEWLTVEPKWEWFAGILVLSFLYYGMMEYWKGATLGKILLQIKVTSKSGDSLSFGQAILRWLGKTLSEIFFFFANFWFYFDKQKIQTLYDKWSNTIVVER